MVRVVLDTNVVVSACLTPGGAPATVVELALLVAFELWISVAVSDEYREVLSRKKFSRQVDRIQTLLEGIEDVAHAVTPNRILAISKDEEDNRLLECAEAAEADFLITGNPKDFPASWGKTRVVSPREFLDEFRF